MSAFSNFLEINRIMKKDIAEYLGVSNAYVSQLVTGEKRLSEQKMSLLRQNSEWDLTPFDSPDESFKQNLSESPDASLAVKELVRVVADQRGRLNFLQDQNKSLQDQNKRLFDLVEKLTDAK